MHNPRDKPWIEHAINPNQPVVFLDTDSKGWLEADGISSGAGGPVNTSEASMVQSLVLSLSGGGINGSSIGVITPFRSQVSCLLSLDEPMVDNIIFNLTFLLPRSYDC